MKKNGSVWLIVLGGTALLLCIAVQRQHIQLLERSIESMQRGVQRQCCAQINRAVVDMQNCVRIQRESHIDQRRINSQIDSALAGLQKRVLKLELQLPQERVSRIRQSESVAAKSELEMMIQKRIEEKKRQREANKRKQQGSENETTARST